MIDIEDLYNKVLDGYEISKDEALDLYKTADISSLKEYANKIRKHFSGNKFDLCTIVNAKSGKCSENCKFCAQSAHNKTCIEEYPLKSTEELVKDAIIQDESGVLRYSIVTSGRKLTEEEVDSLAKTVKEIKKVTNLHVCVSAGLLTLEQFNKLKEAGVSRIHNNLETARRNFSNICSTHTIDDKIETIKNAKKAGFEVCSGGIMGLGETVEDRIDLAFTLKELKINSVPLNMLNPIKGTPLENNKQLSDEEMQRIVAVFRFILPKVEIRLAGGRGIMKDKGFGCFEAGANATISGDMLTTQGITVKRDKETITKLGYTIKI